MFVARPVYGMRWPARLILIAFSLLALAGTLLYIGQSGLHPVSSPAVQRATTAKAAASGVPSRVLAAYGDLPIAFERNHGQTGPQVKFLSRGHGYTLFLTGSEAVLSWPAASTESMGELRDQSQDKTAKHRVRNAQSRPSSQAVLRMQLVGSRTQPQVVGENALPGVSNYYIGNDPRKWQTGIPQYARVAYRDVYPGIDLAFHGAQKQLEFDFVVSPGAKPQQIALHFSGARHLRADDAGGLVLTSAAGDLHLHKPFAYQENHGARQPVDARFVLKGNNQAAFAVGAYDARRQLVIDPTVTYATYLGGTGEDKATAVAVDSSGNAYITGETSSTNFPVKSGAFAGGTGHDAFIVKLDPTGATEVYGTFLGGPGDDSGNAIVVDASGNAYVAGGTQSTSFPGTSGHFQTSLNGAFEKAFVAKLDSSGAISYATYLGGTLTVALAPATNVATGIAVDGSGNAYVAGQTDAKDFPTQNAFQSSLGGGIDAFVTVLNTTATSPLLYSTYLGGAGNDNATAIAFNTQRSRVDVTGVTLSSPFPTPGNPFQAAPGGQDDAFVAELDTTKSGAASLVYSTYLGGTGNDDANGIAVAPTGAVYITGLTQSSTNFPTKNAFQPTFKSTAVLPQNAFIAKLDPTQAGAASLIYSTYLGGTGSDDGLSIAVDGAGNAYVTGQTSSPDFPLQGATQTTFGGFTDAFVTELNAAGNALAFSTFLGGSLAEDSSIGGISGGIAVDNGNNIYVVGSTASTNFPVTTGAFQTSFQGGTADAFAARFTAATPPTFTLSASTPAPNPVAKGSSATSTITLNAANGFIATVALTCAAPAGITCSPNPASVTASAPTSTLTINVSATASLNSPSIRPDSRPLYVLWLPVPGLALMGIGLGSLRLRKKKLLGLLLGLSVFAGLVLLIACGSSSKGGGGGGPTPYTVTVTGTAGSISNNVAVSGTFQ